MELFKKIKTKKWHAKWRRVERKKNGNFQSSNTRTPTQSNIDSHRIGE